MKQNIRTKWFALTLTAALALTTLTACGNGAGTASLPETPGTSAPLLEESGGVAGTVLLSVNPEIEMDYDDLGNVVALTGRNQEAQTLLASYTGYQGRPCTQVVGELVDEINASNRFIKQLVEAKSKSDSLNMVLTNNLTRSLSNDELKEVDIKVLKGVVYISLADNMLYKSGSYEVNERAGQTLSKIAKIITDYKDYDVLVEGNTDPVPISRPNIRNNWDLSALRASSVVQVLQNQYGVDPKRLTAAGRGEYNPIADNDTELGRQRNRRTQIIITPKLDQFMDLIDKAPDTEESQSLGE